MKIKGDKSTRKAWQMTLVAIVDDVVVLGLIFLGLWIFHVDITWWIILIVVAVLVVLYIITYRSILPVIRRHQVNGAEGMVGMTGIVTESCQPKGTVKINGEYWQAWAVGDAIEKGEDVEVVGINGLNLEVKKQP